jgi:putative transposase
MVQSISRKANRWDHATMESFVKAFKVEHTHRLRYTSRAQAKLDLIDGIEGFHTSIRLPLAIGSRSPADFERSSKAA